MFPPFLKGFFPGFVFFFFALIALFARDVEIIVIDTELSLPLEGAVVRSWDGKQYICDAEGKALVLAPDERPVVIQAAYPGYENGRLVVVPERDSFTLGLSLSGIMEGKELVIEASRPGNNETKTGRSVAVSEKEIARTGEIGLIEDVMTTIKLLPGVGYAGFFNAQPSIRGGDPGDMSAALDGYYIDNPYHWGGGFSIFDPRMVQSAQLSHGVFSVRYGHTISGLLEIASKKPSPTEIEFELGVNTSAANFNLSLPLFSRGGIMFMGKVTYYDPFVWLAKKMATVIEELDPINAVRVAPYIRSGTITGNYRFYDDLELHATGFWGSDGVGVNYENSSTEDDLESSTDMFFDWNNYQGFITAGLNWNPRKNMLLNFSAGTGYRQAKLEGDIVNDIHNPFSDEFIETQFYKDKLGGDTYYEFDTENTFAEDTTMINAQGRIDYDWEIGSDFLVAAGAQEMFSRWIVDGNYRIRSEIPLSDLMQRGFDDPALEALLKQYPEPEIYINFPTAFDGINVDNKLYTSSGYALLEYNTPNKRFGAETGLRVDHFYLVGRDFSIQTMPALNPRINLDFNVFKNRWIFNSLDLSAGTGLFSSMNSMVNIADSLYGIEDFDLKPNRSWTSVAGAKLEFAGGLSLNVEGYYKYIYDRGYVPVEVSPGEMSPEPYFDGVGRVWGIDLMIQKMQSRYWDGWISYSYNHSRYLDPHGGDSMSVTSGGNREDDWYFPSYHRFHNLNLVFNIRPTQRINIFTRLGLASGVQISRIVGGIKSYPVIIYEEDGSMQIIEKYRRETVRDEDNRTTPSIPLDIKFSILGYNKSGKAQYEVYVAVENVLALLYTAQGNTSFNSYTGKEDTGSNSASYEMPIPVPSFGFKISY
ncbi:MAG: TonB-dependent receptor plug domain-containing protein [Treponema sp.]|jgi:hypothetical protein|nr:TonB-dependent receptor plug domain-containing protein [Treponema sp.]